MKTIHSHPRANVVLIGCLSAVLGLAACQQDAQDKTGQTTTKAGEKVAPAKDTAELQAEKAGAYMDKPAAASKGAAEQTGKQIDQTITDTERKIESGKDAAADTATEAGEYIDDAAITLKVKTAILNDPVLKAPQIEVTTVNGVVSLSGSLDSQQLIDRVVGLVSSQKDVKSVQNNLTVIGGAPGKP